MKKNKMFKKPIYKFLSKNRIILIIAIVVTFFLTGTIFQVVAKQKIDAFTIKHIIMCIFLFVGLYSLNSYAMRLKKIEADVSTDPMLSVHISRLIRLSYSFISVTVGVAASIFYLWLLLDLKFVDINLVGLYSLTVAFIDIMIAAIILMQYIFLVARITRISKRKITRQHNYNVSKTVWLVQSYSLANYCRNTFFILVSGMVLIFISFSRPDMFTLLISRNKIFYGYTPTIIYFSTVAFYDIVVLPVLSLLQTNSFRKIVGKINQDTIKGYEKKLDKAKLKNSYKYLSPIEYISSVSDKFLDNRKGKFIPVFSYIFNAVSIGVSIATGIVELI